MSKGRRKGALEGLTQREQEAMNLIYQYGPCSAITIQEHMSGDLKNATVRTILRILEAKNHVEHENKGNQFFFKAVVCKKVAASQIFNSLLSTFFKGSITDAVATFIDEESLNIKPEELEELALLIERSKK